MVRCHSFPLVLWLWQLVLLWAPGLDDSGSDDSDDTDDEDLEDDDDDDIDDDDETEKKADGSGG